MKFRIKADDLKQALMRLSRVVKPNKAIPILGYVRCQVSQGQLHLYGTDHRVYYIIPVEADVLDGEEEILLSLSETHTMLAKVAGADVEIGAVDDGERVVIRSGNTTWNREARTSVDMPRFPVLSEDIFQTVEAGYLVKLVTTALRACPKRQTFAPGITQLWFHDGYVDSGDGQWYQRISCPQLASVETTLPIEGAKTLIAVARGWEGSIQFGHTATHVVVRHNSEVLGITRYALAFPDISPYLDNPQVSHTEHLAVPTQAFTTALRQVALSAPSDTGLVRLDLNTPTKIKFSSKTHEGSAETYCDATWEGKPRTVFVDWRGLAGVVAACGNPDKFVVRFGPDTARTPSTLFIQQGDVTAALVQLRGRP